MICDLCSSLDLSKSDIHVDPNPPFTWDSSPARTFFLRVSHQADLPSLFASADNGCHLCTLIRSELLHIRGHESKQAGHQGFIEFRLYLTHDEATDFARLEMGEVGKAREIQVVAITVMRDIRLHLDFIQFEESLTVLLEEKARNNSSSIGCEENFKLAISWISRCLKTHSICTIATLAMPPLPTRVLDVRSERCPSRLSLIPTSDLVGRYITLSHVWGKAQIITTTKETFQDHVKGIELGDLSNTFRDAVTTAREMNVRYLWIDSLCIIQNDLADWEQESVKMGSYYSNALFNIAAVSASNGSGGCFLDHNTFETTPCPTRIVIPGTKLQTSDGFLRTSTSWDPVDQVAAFQRPPLWQRAWVLQERMLSNRLLMFSSMQMSWKCRQEDASESFPEGSTRHSDIDEVDRMLHSALMGLKKFQNPSYDAQSTMADPSKSKSWEFGTNEELRQLYDSWYNLVTLYGKCGLTVASDIFPAISGIANFMKRSTQDSYVAGLWTRDLHRGLLWNTPDSTMLKPDPRHYRAPSWSWASLPATCVFHVRQISQTGVQVSTDKFIIHSIVSQSIHEFPYGRAGVGALEVSGLLKRAHPMDTDAGLPEEEAFKDIAHKGETLFDLEGRRAVGWYFADNLDRRYLTQIWCCPVMTEEREPRHVTTVLHGQLSNTEARGLALLRLDEEKKIFMRVGSIWIKDWSWFSGSEMQPFSII